MVKHILRRNAAGDNAPAVQKEEVMPDYKNMTAVEALRHAKEVSGLTAEEIASRMGVTPRIVRSYLDRGADYEPGLGKIPGLCRAMGNRVLLDWIAANLEEELEVSAASSRADVLTSVARVTASLGDVQRCLADSEGRGIDPACAREVRSLLSEVIAECRVAQSRLRGLAAARDVRDMAPLYSLKQKPRRPWWRFWEEKA